MNNTPGSTAASLQERLAGPADSGRQAFVHGLSQHGRLISIETPLEPGELLVQGFTGQEEMSRLFRFDVDCLATSAHYELKGLIGEEVTLRLQMADGKMRLFHGIVTEARQLGSDGSLASYRLTLEPWLHALTLRRDSYVYQDKTVLEILEDVFKDYPNASFRFDVNAELPKRSLAVQYRETDFDFIARLLAEEGLNFFFTNDDDRVPDSTQTQNGKRPHARHCFVVFDNNAALAACAQASVRFHRAGATEKEDTVTLLSERHQITSNGITLGSWDYKTLHAYAAEDNARLNGNVVPPLEIYEGGGAYRYSDARESERIARARAESLALQSRISCGESSVRAFAVGTWFTLTSCSEPVSPQQHEYVVLSIEHCGSNNLPPNASGLLPRAGVEPGTYRNHFACAPRSATIRPPYRIPKPSAPGAQVALVVGVTREEIMTERDHRIKIQFPWQRGEQAATGQLQHPATSNATGDESAGTWVRVAEPAAGANWGSHFIPRIGQEVLVDFVAGDIDRPVVTGQLYNGLDMPSFHGADNHAGALAGIRSKEYAGDGFNQWTIDDTPNQLRQSFSSSYAASQLNAGYLIRQNGNVRGVFRGTGFELATDAWSSLRAKRGIFLSTVQRNSAVSTQLDTQEAQGKLKTGAEMAKSLSEGSIKHNALPLSTSEGMQQLIKAVDAKNVVDAKEVAAFAQPVVLFDSEAGIATATPASAVAFAGHDVTLSATSAMRISAGQAASFVVANTASLFTHSGGAKIIAAKEPVSMGAHAGPMDVLADQAMTVTSSNGNIRIDAKLEISLAAGGGYIRLSGPNIDIHCLASVSVKGTTHDFLGPDKTPAQLPELPGKCN